MSRPYPKAGLPPLSGPDEKLAELAASYRSRVDREAYTRLVTRVQELGLSFAPDELTVLAALDHPAKVQEFLNTEIYYNYDHPTLDHATPDSEETAMPPRRVLQTGRAHCFEGACFAYAVNYLHGHDPRWLLLEASQDSDHNLILYRDLETGRYGVNAHSGYPNLLGQPARFSSCREVAESYFPYYYSDYTLDPNDVTLMGFSEPIDFVAKYGTSWIASNDMLWDIYYTYIDDTVRLHYIFDDTDQTHLYPFIRAIREEWIAMDEQGRAVVRLENLPASAVRLWHSFWNTFDRASARPRDAARRLEAFFFTLTGTTPLDLEASAEELVDFLQRGYRTEQLLLTLR